MTDIYIYIYMKVAPFRLASVGLAQARPIYGQFLLKGCTACPVGYIRAVVGSQKQYCFDGNSLHCFVQGDG